MIARLEYITVSELNEVLNTSYPNDTETEQKIIEASELMNYYMFGKDASLLQEWQTHKLKLATAYQVEYFKENDVIDNNYIDGNATQSLGRFSQAEGSGKDGLTNEYQKLSPKSKRYLYLGNLLYSGV